ncbi:ABC transporter ATP-binding protein [Derxia gummosa]|uniref:ABC transporter ATP-binding protein n=1 Tax=Derxia gummosa DSM 723 TaxID=1121388 RepID=A0A8B6X7D5_9BURK|nr:ATP-binding cassette domain-containing protein [Derxia gummosa]
MLELRGLARLNVGPIDLVVGAGECLAITGPSGAGKSLLLRMVADLDPHDGDCLLDGRSCAGMPATAWRAQVRYLPAESGWWRETVAEHFPSGTDFAAGLPALGLPAEAARWPVARLSTGERQRLALLRAIGPGVRVLLLDEPTSGLDAGNVAAVESLLAAQCAAGVALLLVTHDEAQAARLATRRLRLAGGRLATTEGAA